MQGYGIIIIEKPISRDSNRFRLAIQLYIELGFVLHQHIILSLIKTQIQTNAMITDLIS